MAAAQQKRGRGRPLLMTAEKRKELLTKVGEGLSLHKACKAIGITRETLRQYLIRGESGADPVATEFLAHYARAQEDGGEAWAEKAIDLIENTTAKNAAANRVKLDGIKWIAAVRKPRRYGNKVDVNHGVQPNDPLATLIGLVVEEIGNKPWRPPGEGSNEGEGNG